MSMFDPQTDSDSDSDSENDTDITEEIVTDGLLDDNNPLQELNNQLALIGFGGTITTEGDDFQNEMRRIITEDSRISNVVGKL